MLFFTPPWIKKAAGLAKGVHKFLQYNRDLMPPERVAEVEKMRAQYIDAVKRKDRAEAERLEPEMVKNCETAVPEYRTSPLRENIEVIIVAVVVALGIRAYFLQPFKIPTASMQPTLNGITAGKLTPEQPMPGPAGWVLDLLVRGRNYPELKVPDDFPLSRVVAARQTNRRVPLLRRVPLTVTEIDLLGNDGVVRTLSVSAPKKQLFETLWINPQVNKILEGRIDANDGELPGIQTLQIPARPGEVLARGYVDTGDQVLVDKLSYHFRKPRRGEVFVFSTAGIQRIQETRPSSPSQHYIKRLVALPGDKVRVEPPYLMINGARAQEPGFQKVMAAVNGYNGYVLPPGGPTSHLDFIQTIENADGSRNLQTSAEATVPPDTYLPMGDNSAASFDGRNFGPVRQENLLGPALVVYWPFLPHFGIIR